MATPLFPHHKNYSAIPTGIIPAWWLLQSSDGLAVLRDLKSLSTGGAIRHKRYTVEFSKLADGEWCFFVMDRKRNVIARCEASIDKDGGDSASDRFEKLTDALTRCYKVVTYHVLTRLGMTPRNTMPVAFNHEAPEMKSTHKTYQEIIDLQTVYRKLA